MGMRGEVVASKGAAVRAPVQDTHEPEGGGGAPSLYRVAEPPQGPPLRAEAAEVAKPAEEEGGWG